jgi:hypothetical protein
VTPLQINEPCGTIRRRKGPTDAMMDFVCMHSPVMSAFRDEARCMSDLIHKLHCLHAVGEDLSDITAEIEACYNRQRTIMRWVDKQWGAVFAERD